MFSALVDSGLFVSFVSVVSAPGRRTTAAATATTTAASHAAIAFHG
jgi:hypothetical protein